MLLVVSYHLIEAVFLTAAKYSYLYRLTIHTFNLSLIIDHLSLGKREYQYPGVSIRSVNSLIVIPGCTFLSHPGSSLSH